MYVHIYMYMGRIWIKVCDVPGRFMIYNNWVPHFTWNIYVFHKMSTTAWILHKLDTKIPSGNMWCRRQDGPDWSKICEMAWNLNLKFQLFIPFHTLAELVSCCKPELDQIWHRHSYPLPHSPRKPCTIIEHNGRHNDMFENFLAKIHFNLLL